MFRSDQHGRSQEKSQKHSCRNHAMCTVYSVHIIRQDDDVNNFRMTAVESFPGAGHDLDEQYQTYLLPTVKYAKSTFGCRGTLDCASVDFRINLGTWHLALGTWHLALGLRLPLVQVLAHYLLPCVLSNVISSLLHFPSSFPSSSSSSSSFFFFF